MSIPRAAILLLTTFLGIGTAEAQSPLVEARRQLIEDVAQAVAGTNVCTRYKANPAALTIHALRLGFRFDAHEVQARLEERAKFHAERIKGRTADDICAALQRLYGPEGSNIRNLVREG